LSSRRRHCRRRCCCRRCRARPRAGLRRPRCRPRWRSSCRATCLPSAPAAPRARSGRCAGPGGERPWPGPGRPGPPSTDAPPAPKGGTTPAEAGTRTGTPQEHFGESCPEVHAWIASTARDGCVGRDEPSLLPSPSMLTFANVSKQYGRQLLFVEASFQLNPGEKAGLVGPNGAGKTTLFRLIVGEEAPDEGELTVPKRITIGYFRQDVEEMSGRSVLDEAIAGSGRVGDLHHELESLNHAMTDPDQATDMDRILGRFGEVQEEYDHLGGYGLESDAREVLHGLGFDDE